MLPIDEETMKNNLAANLRYLRTSRHPALSQEALAQKAGVTGKSISRYETAACLPPCYVLAAIAAYFGYTMDDLLAGRLPKKKGSDTNE